MWDHYHWSCEICMTILQAIISRRPTSDNDKCKAWSLRTIKRSKLTVRTFDSLLHLKLTLTYSEHSAWRWTTKAHWNLTFQTSFSKRVLHGGHVSVRLWHSISVITIGHISFLRFLTAGSLNPLSALQAHNSLRLASSHYVTLSQ